MAVYKIFSNRDATIYSGYPYMNTGLDEILECSTNYYVNLNQDIGGSPQASRFLIAFPQNSILNTIDNVISGSQWVSNLRVFNALAKGLTNSASIAINAVAQDWDMGSGRYLTNPINTSGTSWITAGYSGSTMWITSSFPSGITGSFNIANNPSSAGGGTWYTGSQVSQSFSYYSDLDIKANVTDIVTNWYSGSYSNYGFIVRQTSSQEFVNDINQQTELRYFSTDTHTIYPPCLEFKWYDYTFDTGSSQNQIITSPDALISLNNDTNFYYSNSITKFRVFVTPKYPIRRFMTSSYYMTNYYLPNDVSLYAVKDTETNEFVIDFDSTYTKISADSNSSYFTIFMNGLEPERHYTVLIQTVIDGNTIIFDNNLDFKVING
jgi:hypothetical protein